MTDEIAADMTKSPHQELACEAALPIIPTGWTPVLYDVESIEGQSILAAELATENLFIADMNGRLLEKLVEMKGDSSMFEHSYVNIKELPGLILDILEWTEHRIKCAGMNAAGMKRITSAARICSAIRICCLQGKVLRRNRLTVDKIASHYPITSRGRQL